MRRRTKGDGTIYRKGRFWHIAYKHPDGTRRDESTRSERRTDAERLLRRRIGAGTHNLPVIPNAERLSFYDGAQAVINDFTANGKRSLTVAKRRIEKHLTPYFEGFRLAGITRDDVTAYVAHRQKQGIVNKKDERLGDVSNAEINRELQLLKRIFSLAIKSGRLAMRPDIPMLREAPARAGFFERDQYEGVLAHLPEEVRPIVTFAYITGWRTNSEVLPLEWRNVDFEAGEVRLDAGTTKNGDGRVFPMTAELREVLKSQEAERDRLKKAGHIVRHVFFRERSPKGRGEEKSPQPIKGFEKSWTAACKEAGCPGRIPHDLRRTAVRNLVRAGISQTVAMKMTGHKTDSVFRRYDIVSDGDLHHAARLLDAFGGVTAAGRVATVSRS